jgi:hypothetical protein
MAAPVSSGPQHPAPGPQTGAGLKIRPRHFRHRARQPPTDEARHSDINRKKHHDDDEQPEAGKKPLPDGNQQEVRPRGLAMDNDPCVRRSDRVLGLLHRRRRLPRKHSNRLWLAGRAGRLLVRLYRPPRPPIPQSLRGPRNLIERHRCVLACPGPSRRSRSPPAKHAGRFTRRWQGRAHRRADSVPPPPEAGDVRAPVRRPELCRQLR